MRFGVPVLEGPLLRKALSSLGYRSPFLVFLLMSAPLQAEDWTTAYGGLSRQSYVAGEAVSPPFAIQWETTMPTPLKGGPIVSGLLGHAYLCNEQLQVWALKLADGSVAWKHDEPRDPSEVKCYDALTGALRWTARVDGNLIHTPQVGQNAVYVATSQGKLYAFNQLDGKQIWQVSLAAPLTLPAADATLVIVGSGSNLVGVAAATGARVFSTDLGSAVGSVPVLADDDAYAALGESVAALDRAGKVKWQARLPRPAWAPIAVTKAGVVAASVDGGVKLLSRATGAKVWETVLAGTPNAVSGAGDVVYVGTRQGGVVGLKLGDGAKLWSASLEHGVIDGVGVSGGRVLVTAGKWVASLLPAPDAPNQVALAKDGQNSRLTWAAPAVNGSALSAYRVWRRRGRNVTMLGTVPGLVFGEPILAGEVGYQVSAIAENGAESVRSGEVTLAKGEPLLRRVAVTPVPYDSRTGALTVTFDLRETARVTWVVADAEGKALTEERTVWLASGPGSLVWDGRTREGLTAEPGVYRVSLRAAVTDETDAQARAIPVVWGMGPASGGSPLAGPLGGSGSAAAGVPGNAGAGAAAGGGTAGGRPASGGTTPAASSDPAPGNDNNGVRDHGVGEGRDGAGQGNGQGARSGM